MVSSSSYPLVLKGEDSFISVCMCTNLRNNLLLEIYKLKCMHVYIYIYTHVCITEINDILQFIYIENLF